jgi:quercetin dioxygenase-like cupin family protein
MNRRRLTMAVAGAAAALVGAWASGSLKAQQPGFKRVELQRHDLGVPGREAVQVRAEFEPGASIGKHTHPGEEFGYLLEGTLELEIAGKPNATLKAGDTFFVPPETVHAARNVGKGPAKVLATYVVEKGKPLATMAKETAASAPAPK